MGFKKTSETIAISFSLTESAPNTYTEEEIALQLDVLNNEIFVVLAVDINLQPPEAVPGTNTSNKGTVSSTSALTIGTLARTNVLAVARDSIQAVGFIDSGVGFSRSASESYTGDLDYVGLISTNNFHVGIQGEGNAIAKGLAGRVWGYRARADASTYAALVQSEVLSA